MLKMFCFAKICCLCLNGDRYLIDISINNEENLSFFSKVKILLPNLENFTTPHFPKWLCRDCKREINRFHNLHEKWIKNNQLLHIYSLQLAYPDKPLKIENQLSIQINNQSIEQMITTNNLTLYDGELIKEEINDETETIFEEDIKTIKQENDDQNIYKAFKEMLASFSATTQDEISAEVNQNLPENPNLDEIHEEINQNLPENPINFDKYSQESLINNNSNIIRPINHHILTTDYEKDSFVASDDSLSFLEASDDSASSSSSESDNNEYNSKKNYTFRRRTNKSQSYIYSDSDNSDLETTSRKRPISDDYDSDFDIRKEYLKRTKTKINNSTVEDTSILRNMLTASQFQENSCFTRYFNDSRLESTVISLENSSETDNNLNDLTLTDVLKSNLSLLNEMRNKKSTEINKNYQQSNIITKINTENSSKNSNNLNDLSLTEVLKSNLIVLNEMRNKKSTETSEINKYFEETLQTNITTQNPNLEANTPEISQNINISNLRNKLSANLNENIRSTVITKISPSNNNKNFEPTVINTPEIIIIDLDDESSGNINQNFQSTVINKTNTEIFIKNQNLEAKTSEINKNIVISASKNKLNQNINKNLGKNLQSKILNKINAETSEINKNLQENLQSNIINTENVVKNKNLEEKTSEINKILKENLELTKINTKNISGTQNLEVKTPEINKNIVIIELKENIAKSLEENLVKNQNLEGKTSEINKNILFIELKENKDKNLEENLKPIEVNKINTKNVANTQNLEVKTSEINKIITENIAKTQNLEVKASEINKIFEENLQSTDKNTENIAKSQNLEVKTSEINKIITKNIAKTQNLEDETSEINIILEEVVQPAEINITYTENVAKTQNLEVKASKINKNFEGNLEFSVINKINTETVAKNQNLEEKTSEINTILERNLEPSEINQNFEENLEFSIINKINTKNVAKTQNLEEKTKSTQRNKIITRNIVKTQNLEVKTSEINKILEENLQPTKIKTKNNAKSQNLEVKTPEIHENFEENLELSVINKIKYSAAKAKTTEINKNLAENLQSNIITTENQNSKVKTSDLEASTSKPKSFQNNLESEEFTSDDSETDKEDIFEKYKNKDLICKYCPKEYKREISLKKHILEKHIGTEVVEIKCLYCNFKSIKKYRIFDHIKYAHRDIDLKCVSCNEEFKSFDDLVIHLRIHYNINVCHCSICKQIFLFRKIMYEHMETAHKETSFPCIFCPKKRNTVKKILSHINALHTEQTISKTICEICGKYITKESMKRHLSFHANKKFICLHCGIQCRESCLRVHEKVCATKGKKHQSAKFPCDICKKEYTSKINLKKHLVIHDPKKKIFKCKICGLKFRLKTILEHHERTHTGNRPNICKICNKGFAQQYALTVHMRVHTQYRPYRCDECGAEYKQGYSYKLHMKKKHSIDYFGKMITKTTL